LFALIRGFEWVGIIDTSFVFELVRDVLLYITSAKVDSVFELYKGSVVCFIVYLPRSLVSFCGWCVVKQSGESAGDERKTQRWRNTRAWIDVHFGNTHIVDVGLNRFLIGVRVNMSVYCAVVYIQKKSRTLISTALFACGVCIIDVWWCSPRLIR